MSAALLSGRALVAQRPQHAVAARQSAARVVAPLTVAKLEKAGELRVKYATPEAIAAEVQNCKEEMFRWRIKFAKADDWKPAEYRRLKRRVATLLTIKRERELAEGVLPTKRDARAAEQRRLTDAGLGQF